VQIFLYLSEYFPLWERRLSYYLSLKSSHMRNVSILKTFVLSIVYFRCNWKCNLNLKSSLIFH
jgi:hypothetical protein